MFQNYSVVLWLCLLDVISVRIVNFLLSISIMSEYFTISGFFTVSSYHIGKKYILRSNELKKFGNGHHFRKTKIQHKHDVMTIEAMLYCQRCNVTFMPYRVLSS